jgi:hypothetical protein
MLQLRRAEDLVPLYAHALAQLRAACDLLIVRDRELAVLRGGSHLTTASTSEVPTSGAAVPPTPEHETK